MKLKSLHAIPHPAFPPLPMPPRLLRKLYSGPILLSHALLHQIRAYIPFPRAHGGLSAVQLLILPQPLSPVTHNRLQESQRQPEIRDLKLISGLSPPSSRRPSGAAPSPCRAALEEDVTEVRDPDQKRN